MKHPIHALLLVLSAISLTSCAPGMGGGFGDYGARVKSDRSQSHKLITEAEYRQFGRQRANEGDESSHQGRMQQEGINSYLRPLHGVRDAVGTVSGIGGFFR